MPEPASHFFPLATAKCPRQVFDSPDSAYDLATDRLKITLVHGSDNHMLSKLHNDHRAAQPKRPQLNPRLSPDIPESCDVLTALQRVPRQITHQALRAAASAALAQVCIAPPLLNIPTIELGQIPRAIGI